MGGFFAFVILAIFGSSAIASSVKIVSEKNEYLVERLGSCVALPTYE